MNRSHACPFVVARATLAAIAGCAATLCGSSALAQTLNWNNAVGGAAATSGNWSPIAVPGAGNDLVFNLNATYSLSWTATVGASRTHTYRQGAVTHTFSSPHTTGNGVAIGDLAGDISTVTLTTGTWNSGPAGFVNIGDAGGSTGTFNINDDDADFAVTGTSDLFVGNNGLGTMNITGGGTVTCNDTMHIGQGSAATGNLTVSGFVGTAPFPISTLAVNGTGESRWGNGGDATVNINNGARAEFLGDLVIANLSTSVTNVTVQGNGLVIGATIDVGSDLLLGRNTSAGTAAGVATLNVNTPGRVLVGGTMFVAGDPDGGSATLNLNTGGLVQANSIAQGAGGIINHNGGTLTVNGGTYTGHADPLVVSDTAGPTLRLTGGLSKTLSPAGAVGLIVGDDLGAGTWTGTLLIDGGADLILSGASKDINIGDDTGTTGSIIVNGAGSRLVATDPGDDIRVGFNGIGTLLVENGGQLLARNILVPATATNGDGTLTTSAVGSPVITTVNLSVGNSAGGPGDVAINETAVLNATDPGIGVLVRATGVLGVSTGGLLNATGTVLVDGGILRVNGTVQAGTLVDIATGGLLQSNTNAIGVPEVDAPTRIRSGGVLEAVLDDLTVGDATSASGFAGDDGSVVTIGGTTLTLLDSNRATVDVVTINGGEIIAPNGLEIVTPAGVGGTLDGTGTITTAELFMESGGSVITATGTNGIIINGKFRNNSGLIDGTKFTFNNNPAISDSGWTGAGTIAAQVVFNSGTQVYALANMTMGNNTAAGATFNAGSEIYTNSHLVTLVDSNGIGLPSLTRIGNGNVGSGILACTQPLTLNFGRTLEGFGRVETPLLTIIGTLRPEVYPVDTFARLQTTGSVTFSTNSDVFFDIYGDDVDTLPYDRINATGALTISGAAATIHASFAGGFVPAPGTSMTLMTGSTRTGVFPNHDIPPHTKIEYGPNYVALLVLCPADFNEDGVVDFFDYLDFVDAFSGNLPTADFNRDSVIDFFDYLDYVDVFSSGC